MRVFVLFGRMGVRDDTFHAGVFPPAAYGLGMADDVFHAGVRPSAYGLGPWGFDCQYRDLPLSVRC
jgi:hypothetical protein